MAAHHVHRRTSPTANRTVQDLEVPEARQFDPIVVALWSIGDPDVLDANMVSGLRIIAPVVNVQAVGRYV